MPREQHALFHPFLATNSGQNTSQTVYIHDDSLFVFGRAPYTADSCSEMGSEI